MGDHLQREWLAEREKAAQAMADLAKCDAGDMDARHTLRTALARAGFAYWRMTRKTVVPFEEMSGIRRRAAEIARERKMT